jgi:hypothetical protein
MTICPYDCSPCYEASCRRDGCKHINETIRLICEGCGEPVGCVNCLNLCIACVQTADRAFSARRLRR